MIGVGSLRDELVKTPGVVVKDFMQPEQLKEEISKAGCLVLPSVKEPWGVIVHEASASGLPLLLSDVVGSCTAFLISGFNGYSFSVDSPVNLVQAMSKIINHSDDELQKMSKTSYYLSNRITPETSANNLYSIKK